MDYSTLLKRLRKEAGLTQAALAERLGKNNFWVSHRETKKVELQLTDIAEWVEACGYELDVGVVPKGTTINRTSRPPDAVELAEDLLEAWENMAPASRRMLQQVIRAAANTEP